MKQSLRPILLVVLSFIVTSSVLAQRRERDPLTEKEVDEMRETADFPNKRLELMINFAKERLAAIDQLRADSSAAATRPKQIHDLLQDFLTLLDETGDNVDMYASHRADLRKGLKLLIESTSEWQLKLRQLKEQSPAGELAEYSFVLANAIDAVADSGKDARETLQEQNKLAQAKQLNKDYTERKD
jgi:hypothetical protein